MLGLNVPPATTSLPQTKELYHLRLWVRWLPWTLLSATMVLVLIVPVVPTWVHYLPFLLSILCFGLPHGAVDHLVPLRMAKEQPTQIRLGIIIGVYLALSGLYLVWWYVAPLTAFIAFILLTWYHWGQGDLYTLLHLSGVNHLVSRQERLLCLLIRGGLPMLLPLLFFPTTYHTVITNTVGLFGTGPTVIPGWLFADTTRWWIGLAFGGLVLLAVYWGRQRRYREGKEGFELDVGEIALLGAYFAVVPPLLAVGLYFCLWHAVRHIARLMLVDEQARGRLKRGDLFAAWRRFFDDALPLTLAAVLLLVSFYNFVPVQPKRPDALLGLYLALIAALTFPHTVLVTWMDVRQGVWRR